MLREGTAMAVEIVHWNPVRATRAGRLGKLLSRRRPVNNFGDLLGPLICRELVEQAGLSFERPTTSARLLAVGSIMAMGQPGDLVWGTGVNGKHLDRTAAFADLDVRAVRGPLTRDHLRRAGAEVPEIFGDPGLLVGQLWDRETLRGTRPRVEVSVVPNFHDFRHTSSSFPVISPQLPLWEVLGRIAASDFVVGSSLHGVIIAESLGIPARFVHSGVEPEFKYTDYYEGTGRSGLARARTVEHALDLGPQPSLRWSSENLIKAFPMELWH
jgi:pyruvyltransferase